MTPLTYRVWYRDGKLISSSGGRVVVLRQWPDCAAWLKVEPGPWLGTRPTLPVFTQIRGEARTTARSRVRRFQERLASERSPLLEPDRAGELGETVARLHAGWTTRQRAARAFLGAFPSPLLDLVFPFEHMQWHVMQLLARCPGAHELVATNPALAFALASGNSFHRSRVERPLRSARSLLKRRRADIAAWLGFPGTSSTVNVLAKVPPRAATILNLLRLRSALREPEPPKALRHLPVIDAFAIRVLTTPRLRARVAFSLLADTEEQGHLGSREGLGFVLEDTLRLEDALGVDSRQQIHSREELSHLHDLCTRALNRLERNRALEAAVFPAPPIAGATDIVPILDAKELLREGREMHHCVGTHAPDVAAGKMFVYRVLAPERATLALGATAAGWCVREMKGLANAAASQDTMTAVRDWLRREARPLHPSLRPPPTPEELFGEDQLPW